MKTALLVIDLQRWFLEVGPPEKLSRVEAVVEKANELIDLFHEKKLPVVHVRTVHARDGSTWNQWMRRHRTGRLIAGSREAEAHPALRAAPSDVVLHKTRHSAFIRTELEQILRDAEVGRLVLAGFSIDACVGLTAIEAWERDFEVVLAAEAILGTTPDGGALMRDYLRRRFEMEPVSHASIAAGLGSEPLPR